MTRNLPFVCPRWKANVWSQVFASAWHEIYLKDIQTVHQPTPETKYKMNKRVGHINPH